MEKCVVDIGARTRNDIRENDGDYAISCDRDGDARAPSRRRAIDARARARASREAFECVKYDVELGVRAI